MREHVPLRPHWQCIQPGCGDWPCAPAKARLRADLPPLSLAMYAGHCLTEALTDLPQIAPTVLHQRLLGWVRPPRQSTVEDLVMPALPAVHDVRRPITQDVPQIVDALADMYVVTPVARWLVPDLLDRVRIIGDILHVAASYAVTYDTARVLDDDAGVAAVLITEPATWQLPHGLLSQWECERIAAAGQWSRRLVQLTAVEQAARPQPPCPRLTHIGVRRDRMGDGFEGVLLDWYGRHLDARGLAAHAVTGDERTRDACLRAGWRPGEPQPLPDGGPTLWTLHRDRVADGR